MELMSDLSKHAMLAALRITVWSVNKLDNDTAAKAADANDAATDAGRFFKTLVPKEATSGINAASNAARSEHYRRTLPWRDEGPRILTVTGFDAYLSAMKELEMAFVAETEVFCAAYPDFLESAPKRLGKLFSPTDYPTVDQLRGCFSYRIDFSAMPRSADFQVALPADKLREIQAEIDAQMAIGLQKSARDIGDRIAEVVGHMVTKLKAYEPGSAKVRATGTFKDSLVSNVRDLVLIMPSLDLAKSGFAAELAREMERDLCRIGPATLRVSDTARAKVAAAAEAILAKAKAHFAAE